MKKTNMHHLALAGILGLMAGAAQAQTTYNWVSPTTGSENWSTATWIPGTPAVGGALGDTLVFPAGTYTANNDLTGVHKLTSLNLNNGSAALTLSGNDLFFDGAGSYDNRLVAGVGGAMTVGNNITLGGNYNWYITPYGNVTLNGVISGGMGNGIWLADGGAQVVFANENNSFTNQIGILNNGSLVANANVNNGANGAFGNSYSSIQFPLNGSANTIGLYAGTGGLLLNRRINATVPMSAGGKRIIGGLHTSGWVTIANYIDGPDNQAIQFHAGSGAGVQINDGVIGAPDRTTSIIYEGGGQFSVYAAGGGGNTYSGSTTLRSGYVYLNYNDTGSAGNYSLGSSPVTTAVQLGDSETLSGATIAFISIGKTINHNLAVNNYGGNTYIGGGSSQPSVYAGDIALAKDLWVQSYFSGFGDTTLSGHINDSGAGEALRTAGDGTVILTSSNAYSGGTFVNSGNTVDAQHDGALGSGNVYVANSATLVLGGGAANDYIHSSANLVLSGGNPLVSLNFTGSDTINGLSFDGGATFAANGTWGGLASPAANKDSRLAGTGVLNVLGLPGITDTNTLARVMNAAYAPGLTVDGSAADWSGLASSILYMDTSPNSTLPGQNLGVDIRYAWDSANLYVMVSENTSLVVATNAAEASNAANYQAGPWSFDTAAFWIDLKNTCGLTFNGVKVAKDNADFQPWFGLSSSGSSDVFYARANNGTTMDLAGLASAKARTSGTFAAHNRKVEIAISWADVTAAVATSQQPGGNLAANVAAGLTLGIEPLLILNYWDGQSFIGAGNKWNPPSGSDTNSVDVQLIALTAPPSLTAKIEAGQVVLRWQAAALNYKLWSTAALGASASWSAVPTAPVADPSNPGYVKVSLSASGAAKFFRLKQ